MSMSIPFRVYLSGITSSDSNTIMRVTTWRAMVKDYSNKLGNLFPLLPVFISMSTFGKKYIFPPKKITLVEQLLTLP